jgi:cytochrome c oxidase subunit 3
MTFKKIKNLKKKTFFFLFNIWYGIIKHKIFGMSYYPLTPDEVDFFRIKDDDERELHAETMRPYYIHEINYYVLKNNMLFKRHNFHIVDESPWPFFISFSVLSLAIGFVGSLHNFKNSFELLLLGFIITLTIFILWCKDIISEGTFQGKHTSKVQRGLRIGFTLFIVSEIMLFLSFFWAFFHFSLAPAIEIGGIWPPVDIDLIYPYSVPLLNTIILVVSGGSLTWVHIIISNRKSYQILNQILKSFAILKKKNQKLFIQIYKNDFFFPFIITLFLAVFFTILQGEEYLDAPFSINDSVFGSVFYMTTGLHGLHVIIGTIFITVGFVRFFLRHFTAKHHLGFETSAWYWHFVDVVWILLFILYYVWSYRDHALLLIESIRHNVEIHAIAFEKATKNTTKIINVVVKNPYNYNI